MTDELESRYDYETLRGQHLYLRMVEPVFHIFGSKDWKPVMRYFAQECLAIMSLGCRYLNQGMVLEALYESCQKDDQKVKIYERFCDRRDAKKIPYLLIMADNAYKLEMPMP